MKRDDRFQLSRRAFVAGSGAAMAAATLPGRASALSGDLVVSNWGGSWNDYMYDSFERSAFADNGVDLVKDLAPVSERKTRLLAERRLPRSSVDVTWLSDSDAFEMNDQNVLEEIDYSQLSNADTIIPQLQSPYYVPAIYGGVVVLYNPNTVTTPPTSFADLWNPEYKGRVGLYDQIYFNYIYAAALVAGGDMSNVEPAFDKLMEMKEEIQPRLYPSHDALAAGFENGEIDISANYSARAQLWNANGLPIEMAYPDEGAIAIAFGVGVPKKASNREAAYAYLDAMLSPDGMANIARKTYYSVATTDASLSQEEKEKLEFTDAQKEKLHFVDYDYAAENDNAWLDWWNKEFKG